MGEGGPRRSFALRRRVWVLATPMRCWNNGAHAKGVPFRAAPAGRFARDSVGAGGFDWDAAGPAESRALVTRPETDAFSASCDVVPGHTSVEPAPRNWRLAHGEHRKSYNNSNCGSLRIAVRCSEMTSRWKGGKGPRGRGKRGLQTLRELRPGTKIGFVPVPEDGWRRAKRNGRILWGCAPFAAPFAAIDNGWPVPARLIVGLCVRVSTPARQPVRRPALHPMPE
jgi:hypothetical protein